MIGQPVLLSGKIQSARIINTLSINAFISNVWAQSESDCTEITAITGCLPVKNNKSTNHNLFMEAPAKINYLNKSTILFIVVNKETLLANDKEIRH
jgi:hypothetical protein